MEAEVAAVGVDNGVLVSRWKYQKLRSNRVPVCVVDEL